MTKKLTHSLQREFAKELKSEVAEQDKEVKMIEEEIALIKMNRDLKLRLRIAKIEKMRALQNIDCGGETTLSHAPINECEVVAHQSETVVHQSEPVAHKSVTVVKCGGDCSCDDD